MATISYTSGKGSYTGQQQGRKGLVYQAAERNKEPILSVLRKYINEESFKQLFLEIASGSGQHIAHFAPNFPRIDFIPSEIAESRLMSSIECHSKNIPNVFPPIEIDVKTDVKTWKNVLPFKDAFEEDSLDYMYNSNMLHISEFECTIGLFKAAGLILKPEGILFTYGPFAEDGNLSPQSNVDFDNSLRGQNPQWGVRDIRDLKKLASENKMKLVEAVDMPSNNKTLIWKKIAK